MGVLLYVRNTLIGMSLQYLCRLGFNNSTNARDNRLETCCNNYEDHCTHVHDCNHFLHLFEGWPLSR